MDDNMANKYEHEIPEGYEARIEGNKVIIEKNESEDERIRKEIIELLKEFGQDDTGISENAKCMIAWLEKRKEDIWNEEHTWHKTVVSDDDDDETIRTKLISLINWSGTPWDGKDKDKFIAYIERQKEQKNFQTKVQQRMEYLWDKLPDSHKVENGDCTPEEWKTLGAYMELEMNFDKGSEEKQKEQKTTELDKLAKLREMTHEIRVAYERGIEVGRAESKPVWSEEDERMLRRCIKSIESSKNFAETQTFKDAKDKEKEWLISLPERFNLQDVREQYPIEDCDYGLEIALDILVKTLNKVQGYQTDDGIREHQTAIQAVKDAMKAWSYPYGENETVDRLVSIAECLEMDGDCLFNGYSGTECGKFLRELARKQIECKPAEWSKDTAPVRFEEEDGEKYPVVDYKLMGRKFAEWSEDDEANLDYLIDFCNSYYNGNIRTLTESTARTLSNFLYRVKSGEISLPKSRLDEKDEKTIHLACEFIRHHARKNDSIGGIDCFELVERLKSLRPQPKQAWSKEDEKRLYSIGTQIGFLKGKYSEYQKDIDWLYALAEKMGFHKCKTGEVVTEWKKEDIDDKMLSKPKQEWSEEDEDYMKDLMDYFGHNLPLEHTPHAVRDWLKSLPYRIFSKQIVNKIDDYINKHTYNAHEMHSEGLEKLNYCKGVDDTLSDICDIINNC